MSVIIRSGASGNLANVNSDNELQVALTKNAANAGYEQSAFVPGTGVSKVRRISADGLAYTAEARQLLDINWNAASTNWAAKIGTNATTMTKAVTQGYMRLNASAITTTTTGISIYSNRIVLIEHGYDYVVQLPVRHANATATNKQADVGLGYYGFAAGQAAAMNEFIGFRWTTTGGLLGVLETSQGGAPTSQTITINSNTPYSDSVSRDYNLVISDDDVEFYVDGVYQGRIARPNGSWGILKGVGLPLIARVFNSGAASAACTVDVGPVSVMKMGADDGMPHSTRVAMMGKGSWYWQPDLTTGVVNPYSVPASGTAPTAAVGSNTASAANNTAILGGYVRNTLTGVSATAHTNVLWTAWQNPANPTAAGAATNARNFICTGITISPMVVTTLLAGGGFTAAWFVGVGGTATSLATTDADGTTAVAQKAARLIPLPQLTTLAASAAAGTTSTDVGGNSHVFTTPLVVHPGEFLHVGFRTIFVTAAVTSGAADCAITPLGYWD